VASVWIEGLARSFDDALDLLAGAVRDCTPSRWETPMWEVPPRDPDAELLGPDGTLVTDPASRRALVQRFSMPWSVAWHALEVLDYDLTGELAPWSPPPPFAGKPHWMLFTSIPPWTPADILGYVEHCRRRVRDTLADMTDEKAATPLPPTHRRHGQPYAWTLTGLVGHTVEHGAQIRQHLTAAGGAPPA
jgi:hypothetical protein